MVQTVSPRTIRMAVDTYKHSAIQGILALGKNSAKKLHFYLLHYGKKGSKMGQILTHIAKK